MIHSALSDFGFNVANLGMHSFRSGGATAGAQNDAPDRLFKIHYIKQLFYIIFCDFNFSGPEVTAENRGN
jgi:hypothetical protein